MVLALDSVSRLCDTAPFHVSYCLITFHCFVDMKPKNINPHLPNGLFHPYQLDESISNFRVSGLLFHLCLIFNRNSCKQTVKTLIRRRVLRRLIWVCTVCLCPKNGALGLYGLSTSNASYNAYFARILMNSKAGCGYNETMKRSQRTATIKDRSTRLTPGKSAVQRQTKKKTKNSKTFTHK